MPALSALPTVRQLHLATVELPEDHPAAPLGRTVPVHGFCIEHPDGRILVDTGVGYGNDFIDGLYRPQRTELAAALAESGIALDGVMAVVNSHLHFDHCGQNPFLFGKSTAFYSQADELRAVAENPYYTDRSWAVAPVDQQHVVRGDEEIADGVRILATPGHTSGHQSVLIEGGDRRVVIGAQAVWHHAEFDAEQASRANVDDTPELRRAAVDSIRRLKALNPEVVYFSHCQARHVETGSTNGSRVS